MIRESKEGLHKIKDAFLRVLRITEYPPLRAGFLSKTSAFGTDKELSTISIDGLDTGLFGDIQ